MSIYNAIKDALDGNKDTRKKKIIDAIRSLKYDFEDKGESIECNFGTTDSLPYESRILLRPEDDEQSIYLGYTIYGKRISLEAPFQSPEAKEAIKGYKYIAGPDSLAIYTFLEGDNLKRDKIAQAIKKIRDTGNSVYTYANIPENPYEAYEICKVQSFKIKQRLHELKVFNEILVSKDGILATYKSRLIQFGVALAPRDDNRSAIVRVYIYFKVTTLPMAQSKELMSKFVSPLGSHNVVYTPICTNEELSFTANFADNAEFVEKFLTCISCLSIYSDVYDAVCDEYKRQEILAAEKIRNKGLANGYAVSLYGNMTIRSFQDFFSDKYPYLFIRFFLLKTSEQANRTGETIMPISFDTMLSQIRTFKGDCKIEIFGASTPESIEKEFRNKSGLVVKIGYSDKNGDKYYIPKNSNSYKKYIYDLNKYFKEQGYCKADIS